MFRLSNNTLQLNLFDHSKLILEQDGQMVTFISIKRQVTTQRLNWWIISGNKEVIERLIYCRDIIHQMILKRNGGSK
jgi:hypothetical protein